MGNDTVVGRQGTKAALLVLSERQSRQEIIFKLQSKTQEQVCKALDRLERHVGKDFGTVFKTITCDNGCEFLNFEEIEASVRKKSPRTKVYYAHPYSAWERGTNENTNKMIRRFVPKGINIATLSKAGVKRVQHWLNHYPRHVLDGQSPAMIHPLSLIA